MKQYINVATKLLEKDTLTQEEQEILNITDEINEMLR